MRPSCLICVRDFEDVFNTFKNLENIYQWPPHCVNCCHLGSKRHQGASLPAESSGWVPKKVCREVVSSKCPKGRKSYPRNAKRWSPRYGKNPFGVWRSLMHFVAHGYIVESPLTSTQCKMQNQQILKEMCTLLPVFLMFSVCFQVLKIWTASLSKQIKPGSVSCPVQACTWHWRPSKMSVEVDGPGHWDHDWLMGFFFMCFPNVFSVLFA